MPTRAPSKQPSTSAKVLYRPVGIVSSVVGGLLSSLLFKQVWKRVSPSTDGRADPPGPLRALAFSPRRAGRASIARSPGLVPRETSPDPLDRGPVVDRAFGSGRPPLDGVGGTVRRVGRAGILRGRFHVSG